MKLNFRLLTREMSFVDDPNSTDLKEKLNEVQNQLFDLKKLVRIFETIY